MEVYPWSPGVSTGEWERSCLLGVGTEGPLSFEVVKVIQVSTACVLWLCTSMLDPAAFLNFTSLTMVTTVPSSKDCCQAKGVHTPKPGILSRRRAQWLAAGITVMAFITITNIRTNNTAS